MNDDKHTIISGHLDVGGGHRIYYQQWGNIKATPTFFLHGGPGSGAGNKYKSNFDPKIHHIIFHDQRGSGNSTPFAEIRHNTTQDLIEDIDKLRKFFKFDRVNLTGGSWGSFLALAYAVEHTKNVGNVLISGIYTGTKAETDYIQQGGLATHFPESWEQYIEVVPKEHRSNTVEFYYDKMLNTKGDERDNYIRRWNINEGAAMSIDPDLQRLRIDMTGKLEEKTISVSILEAHYFVNNCFVDDKYLTTKEAIRKLSSLPIIMVQGQFDHVCPPAKAYELSNLYGENCHLHIVPTNHGNEGALREVNRAYAWSFLK